MATGKIKTLFSDKEKNEALFPRTKTSAISNASGRGLDTILENLPYYSDADSSETVTAPIDADSLGGRPAEQYATKEDLNNIDIPDIDISQIDAGNVDIDLEGAGIGTPAPINVDTLGGFPANSYATKEFVASNAVSMTLLWENASPESGFAEQTIAIDWADYDSLALYFNTGYIEIIAELGKVSHINWTSLNDNNTVCSSYRDIEVVSSGIYISDGKTTTIYGLLTGQIGRLVPQAIYGIKGVTE